MSKRAYHPTAAELAQWRREGRILQEHGRPLLQPTAGARGRAEPGDADGGAEKRGRNLQGKVGRQELLPPGAAMGTQLPLRLTSEKNAHEHWTAKARRVKLQRHYIYDTLSRLWDDGPDLGLPLTITITRIAPRALDSGNLETSVSAVQDGISDWLAGEYLKGQDRQPGLEWRYEQRRVARGFYATEIRVERPKKQQGRNPKQ